MSLAFNGWSHFTETSWQYQPSLTALQVDSCQFQFTEITFIMLMRSCIGKCNRAAHINVLCLVLFNQRPQRCQIQTDRLLLSPQSALPNTTAKLVTHIEERARQSIESQPIYRFETKPHWIYRYKSESIDWKKCQKRLAKWTARRIYRSRSESIDSKWIYRSATGPYLNQMAVTPLPPMLWESLI